MNKRLYLLNGLAIVGVVLNHAAGWGLIAMFLWVHRYRPVVSPNFDQIGSLPYYALITIRQLTSFSVAAFLFVSGFFIVYSVGNRYEARWKIIKARVVNLLVPYAIWSVVIFGSDYLVNHVSHSPLEYLGIFLSTGADGPYFFVPLLCYLYLLTPFLVPLARDKGRLLLFISAFIQLSTSALRYLVIFNIQGPMLDFLIKITPDWSPPRWIFFFVFGLVCGFRIEGLKEWLARIKWKLVAAVGILGPLAIVEPELAYRTYSAAQPNMLFTLPFGWRFVPFPFSTILFSIAAILCFLAFDISSLSISKGFFNLGSRSYGIYLLHMKVMEFLARMIYHFIPIVLALQILFQPILFVVGLGVPLLFMWGVSKSPTRTVYRKLFG